MNRQLHAERIVRAPTGVAYIRCRGAGFRTARFVLNAPGVPHAVLGSELVEWTRDGYGARRSRPVRGEATVITPPSSVSVLQAGYKVQIDRMACD